MFSLSENIVNSPPEPGKKIVSTSNVIVMFALGFYFIPIVFFPSILLFNIAIPKANIVYLGLQFVLCVYCAIIIVRAISQYGFLDIFNRYSKLILFFWILLAIRLVYDDFTSVYRHNTLCLGRVFVPMLAFGLLSEKDIRSRTSFYTVFTCLAVVCFGFTLLLFDVLYIKGMNLRVAGVRDGFVWLDAQNWFLTREYAAGISPFGCILFFLCVYGYVNRYVSGRVYCLTCFCAATCMCSSGTLTAFIGLIFTLALYVLLTLGGDEKKRFFLVILPSLAMVFATALLIGRNVPNLSLAGRISKFGGDMFFVTKNIDEIAKVQNLHSSKIPMAQVIFDDNFEKELARTDTNTAPKNHDKPSSSFEKNIETATAYIEGHTAQNERHKSAPPGDEVHEPAPSDNEAHEPAPLDSETNEPVQVKAEISKKDFLRFSMAGGQRMGIWLQSIGLIKASPILGDHLYFFYKAKYRDVLCNPCNGILSAFLGTGVVGGTLFLLITCFSFYNAVYLFRVSVEFQWLSLLYFVSFIQMLLNMPLQNFNEFWFLLMMLHVSVVSCKERLRSTVRQKTSPT